jgi:hypothetical protein
MVSHKTIQLLGVFVSLVILTGCGGLALEDPESLLHPPLSKV